MQRQYRPFWVIFDNFVCAILAEVGLDITDGTTPRLRYAAYLMAWIPVGSLGAALIGRAMGTGLWLSCCGGSVILAGVVAVILWFCEAWQNGQ